jgi:acyl dehydratase
MTEFSDDVRLYLDDLHIGQRFTSGTHVVDEEQIKAFARQFDPQPFHLDNEAAEDTLFSGLVASRMAHCCDHHAPFSRGLLAVRRRYHRSWR